MNRPIVLMPGSGQMIQRPIVPMPGSGQVINRPIVPMPGSGQVLNRPIVPLRVQSKPIVTMPDKANQNEVRRSSRLLEKSIKPSQ